MQPLTLALRHPRQAAALATGAAALIALTAYRVFRHRPTPEELEARRRDLLAQNGRIHDATLTDALPDLTHPQIILYQYQIAGVTYACSQDISALPALGQPLALELPVQVRYDRHNPGDSIVLAETWNGLWSIRG